MSDSSAPRHPAPHRQRAGWVPGAALLAAPLAWLVQTSFGYGVASHACYPADEPLSRLVTEWPWPAVLAVNIVTILIAAAACLVALRMWRLTREEATGDAGDTIEAGEGRTRFVSLWAMFAGGGFTIALLFSLIAIMSVPPCGYP